MTNTFGVFSGCVMADRLLVFRGQICHTMGPHQLWWLEHFQIRPADTEPTLITSLGLFTLALHDYGC